MNSEKPVKEEQRTQREKRSRNENIARSTETEKGP